MVSFFHSYDLRGKYPGEISETEAEKVGKAYGTWTNTDKVLVGRDGRNHSEKINKAFIKGVASTGVDVLEAGMVPSPVVYYGVRELGLEAGTVVTASHNPSEYTGFKFCKRDALAVSRQGGMAEIEEIYESESFDTGKGSINRVELVQDYIDFIKGKIDLEKDIKVAVNFGNGVTSVLGRQLLEEIGCEVYSVNEEIDGDFPNHLPAPGHKEAQNALEELLTDVDLGIIFDGDGDRAGFMLPEIGYIDEDEVLALFTEESLQDGKGKIVYDLRASQLLKDVISQYGGIPEESPVGHTFISEKIHSDKDTVFAGELSGHYYFPVFGVPYDDGLFSAALMCQIFSEGKMTSSLSSYQDYPVSPELRIDCPHHAKPKVIEGIKEAYSNHELTTLDGVKIVFENGWALVRPSNTEEKMSLRCEADTEKDLQEILEKVESDVRRLIDESA